MNQEVISPFDSKEFLELWEQWREYKRIEFKFKYKSKISEQAALQELSHLSHNNVETAKAIIMQSMANGWRGFFEVKNKSTNGQQNIIGRKTAAIVSNQDKRERVLRGDL